MTGRGAAHGRAHPAGHPAGHLAVDHSSPKCHASVGRCWTAAAPSGLPYGPWHTVRGPRPSTSTITSRRKSSRRQSGRRCPSSGRRAARSPSSGPVRPRWHPSSPGSTARSARSGSRSTRPGCPSCSSPWNGSGTSRPGTGGTAARARRWWTGTRSGRWDDPFDEHWTLRHETTASVVEALEAVLGGHDRAVSVARKFGYYAAV